MQIKILTFNVGLLRIFNWVFTPFIEERFNYLAKSLIKVDADIIALQEIYDLKYKKKLIETLIKNYPYNYYNKKKRLFNLKTDGLLILSKYKISDSINITFRQSPFDEEFLVKKGYLYTKVLLPNNIKLGILNTHLTAGGVFNHPESKISNQFRQTQINELSERVSNKDSCIILGDFNCSPEVSKENFQQLISFDWLSCFDYVHGNNNKNCFTWDVNNTLNVNSPHSSSPSQRIDHIFLTKTAKDLFLIQDCEVILDDKIVPIKNNQKVSVSDHYGLTTTIIRKN